MGHPPPLRPVPRDDALDESMRHIMRDAAFLIARHHYPVDRAVEHLLRYVEIERVRDFRRRSAWTLSAPI